MIERRIINCKVCREDKEAIQNGTYDGKNKRWVDNEGRAFNGKVCAPCNLNRVKNNMKKLRFDRQSKVG